MIKKDIHRREMENRFKNTLFDGVTNVVLNIFEWKYIEWEYDGLKIKKKGIKRDRTSIRSLALLPQIAKDTK